MLCGVIHTYSMYPGPSRKDSFFLVINTNDRAGGGGGGGVKLNI